MNPKWEGNCSGFTDIGQEFLIVPIIDTANTAVPHNGGRLLLITKDSTGAALTGHSLIYIPYKQYNKFNANHFNINDFSGGFIYTDAIGRFIQGKRVSNGKCINYLRLKLPNVSQVRSGGDEIVDSYVENSSDILYIDGMNALPSPYFTDVFGGLGSFTVDPSSFSNFIGLGGPSFGFGNSLPNIIVTYGGSGANTSTGFGNSVPNVKDTYGSSSANTSKGVPPNIFQQQKILADAYNYLKTIYSPADMDYFIEVNSGATLKFSAMLQQKFPNSTDPNSSDYNDAKNFGTQALILVQELTQVLKQLAADNASLGLPSGGFKLFGRVLAKVLKSRAAHLLLYVDAALKSEAAYTAFQAGDYSGAAGDLLLAIADVAPITQMAKEAFIALGIAKEVYDIFQPLSKIYYFCEAKGLQIFEKVFEFIETKGLFSGLGFETTTKGVDQLYIDLAGQKVESILDYLKSLGVSTDLDTGGFNVKVSDGIFVTFYPLNFYPKPGQEPAPSVQINIEGQIFKIRLKNPG